MLAEPSALGALVPVKVRYREPAEREAEFTELARDHARDGRGHLGADGKAPASPVLKIICLLARKLLSALRNVYVERFEHRPAVFLEAAEPEPLPDLSEKPVAKSHLSRVKIPCAFVRLC